MSGAYYLKYNVPNLRRRQIGKFKVRQRDDAQLGPMLREWLAHNPTATLCPGTIVYQEIESVPDPELLTEKFKEK